MKNLEEKSAVQLLEQLNCKLDKIIQLLERKENRELEAEENFKKNQYDLLISRNRASR